MSKMEYNDLIYEISEKLQKPILDFLKFVCRDHVGNDSWKGITTVQDFFSYLEKKDLLEIDRLDLLKDILRQQEMQMSSLLKMVEGFEVQRKEDSAKKDDEKKKGEQANFRRITDSVYAGSCLKQAVAYSTQQPTYPAQPQSMKCSCGCAPAGQSFSYHAYDTPPPYSERPNDLLSSAYDMQPQQVPVQQYPAMTPVRQYPTQQPYPVAQYPGQPPFPGYAPNFAQLGASQGQSVNVQQRRAGWFSGGSGGGYTFW